MIIFQFIKESGYSAHYIIFSTLPDYFEMIKFQTYKTENQLPNLEPGAPPDLISAFPESSTSIRIVWSPPPEQDRNGQITYYKLFVLRDKRPDSEVKMFEIPAGGENGNDKTEFVVDELEKWTKYRIWMLAGTLIGDGPQSEPVEVKTDEDGKVF